MHLSLPNITSAAALALLAAGCVSTRMRLADPVGPEPAPGTRADMGQLVVFTEISEPSQVDYERAVRTPYLVLDANGKEIARVASRDNNPRTVLLSEGDYLVRAPAFGRSQFDVPVRVFAGRKTEVHLDGGAVPLDERKPTAIYAPNGAFVGWRAEP